MSRRGSSTEELTENRNTNRFGNFLNQFLDRTAFGSKEGRQLKYDEAKTRHATSRPTNFKHPRPRLHSVSHHYLVTLKSRHLLASLYSRTGMDGEARNFGENVHVHPRRIFWVGHDHRHLTGNDLQQHQVGHGNKGR